MTLLLTAAIIADGLAPVTASTELRYRPVIKCGSGHCVALARQKRPVRVVFCVGGSWDTASGQYVGGDVVEINGRQVTVEGGVVR